MQKTLNRELFCNAPQGSIEFSVDSTVQSAKGYIEYLVKLRVEDVEYEIGRRFSEFQDLDKNLRYHFPSMEFPALPSKYALFNKIEQRKKCFHSYMQGLVQVLDLIASDQRATLLKLLSIFLKLDGIIEVTDEIQSRSRQNSSVDLMQFPIGTRQYQGWSDVNLDGQWKHFYVSLKSDSLYLHQNMDLSDFMYQINLLLGRIEFGPDDTFGLYHDHQKSPILFKSQNSDLRSALVIICSSYTDSPLSQFKKSSVGRVCVTIHTGNNLRFAKPPVSLVKPHIYVSVDLDSVSCSTRPVPQSESLYWGQSFVLPIFNIFFDLKISICQMTTEGWMRQHAKSEVLDTVRIPLTDINQEPYCKGTVSIKFEKLKSDKKFMLEETPELIVTVTQQSSFYSSFISPPTHYNEDLPLQETASMHDLKIAFKRLKRVRILFFRFFMTIYQVFFWIYPDFSKICMITYSIFIIFLPASAFLPLFLSFLLFYCYLLNPKNKKLQKLVMKMFFSKKNHIDPYPKVITIKEDLHTKKTQFMFIREKTKEGVMKRWKKFKEDAVELQTYIMLIACYLEKLRHLFLWEDPQKSGYFCVGLGLLIVFLILMPFRVILLFVGLHRFYKGYTFTKKRIAHNRRVCEEVVNSLFLQHWNNEIVKADSLESWSKDFIESMPTKKKIIEGLRTRLNLEVTEKVFDECKCPEELTEKISSVEVLLKHRDKKGEHIYESSIKSSNLLWSFLTNVPSEYYRVEHPRLTCCHSY